MTGTILALLALALVPLSASPIAPGPVASTFPLWQVPCDGYTLGTPPFGCTTGETRDWLPTGEVIAGYLKPTPLADPAPLLPAIVPPVWIEDKPVEPEVPLLTATPEPELRDLFVLLAAGVVLWRLLRSETAGGGK